MATTLTSRRIGTITLDAVTEETHQSDLAVTENPVESGALVADHAVLDPQQITVAGVVVDYEPPVLSPVPGDDSLIGEADALIDRADLPGPVAAFTPQTLVRAQRELSSYVDQARILQYRAQSAARAIAEWLPGGGAGAADASSSEDRVSRIHAQLKALQKAGGTIDVQTGLQLYESMLITSIAARQTMDGSAEFVITLRELFVVETKTIKGVSLPAKKRGRASAQGDAKSQKGKTSPEDAGEKNQSLLKRLGGLF
ncbi:hypothetical protein SAMN02800692_1987 [Luteibacter sp. UNC138MFCol5.1]|uniref:phage baseplate protein n=1 Tax=Luteibacter sp. UNC138MFCol5.1 TaxID=1502774 RepID=UPI0008CBE553|nr:hypothetical protein [Luteibacter sp. UNC138MFCol5.1]SEO76252.1 hypothetical protein SAMN02800692_1987 [Luteibacter sp. UNC138MFCol5.1]